MKPVLPAASFLLASLSLVACVDPDTGDEDGADDSFLADGKADASGIRERSPDALGVLTVANTATRDELRDAIGLGATTVKRLLAHRDGPDGRARTNDDNLFDSLTELDGVPYVGVASFQRLLAFARDAGFVVADPFASGACDGPTITRAEIDEVSHGGTGRLPGGRAYKRTRTCAAPGACGPWSAATLLDGTATFLYEGSANDMFFSFGWETSNPATATGERAWWGVEVSNDGTLARVNVSADVWGPSVSDAHNAQGVPVTITGDCVRASVHVPANRNGLERAYVYLNWF